MKTQEPLNLNEILLKTEFEKLIPQDRETLYKAPVLISVYAASSDNRINKAQKAEAIKLAHLRTFTGRAELTSYYKSVEEHFTEHFETLEKEYSPLDENKRAELKKEIDKVYAIIDKLSDRLAAMLQLSLHKYELHIKRSGVGVIDDFIFPIPIKGLNR